MAWFRLFYSDISSCVQNNGRASDFFPLSRGVSQGCPLSSYLFLLCAEILGSAIRNDNVIRGFKVLDTESKISQYADDTTLILDGSESSRGDARSSNCKYLKGMLVRRTRIPNIFLIEKRKF